MWDARGPTLRGLVGRRPARWAAVSSALVLFGCGSRTDAPAVALESLITSEEASLAAADGVAGDGLGNAVAFSADGTRAIVGAPFDDTARGVDAGSVRVFLRSGSTWTEEATLIPPVSTAGANFGEALDVTADATRVIVGAWQDDAPAGSSGSAHVFSRSGTVWTYEAALLAPDIAATDFSGDSVGIADDATRAVVSYRGDDNATGTNAGTARVFVRTGTTWAHEATVAPPMPVAGVSFAGVVAISADGSRLAASNPNDDTAAGANAGSVRVFLRAGTVWTQEAVLVASDGAANDNLGRVFAMSPDASVLVAGASQDDGPSADTGSAHVFARTGTVWAEEAILVAPDASFQDRFGTAVGLSGDGLRVIIGMEDDDTPFGNNAGSARVFLRSGTAWGHEAILFPSMGSAADLGGRGVALSADGSRALLGVVADDVGASADVGTARVFTLVAAPNGAPCVVDAACASGFCTDGVCCGNRCGGTALDCQGCAMALTGMPDGTCARFSAAVAPTVVCRPAVDVCDATEVCGITTSNCPGDSRVPSSTVCRAAVSACDLAERCSGTATACPADVLAAAGTTCRTPSMGCDLAATCTGSSPVCPPSPPASTGTICRAGAGACDVAETCDGSALACPMDGLAGAGTGCRPSVGICDVAEVCSGASPTCPGDAVLPGGSLCRGAVDVCDLAETCTGASPLCPTDAIAAATVTCRPPTSACDVAETCTGSSPNCPPDAFASASTACGPIPSGACDGPDHCAGSSGACVAVFLSSECRPAAGACDLPETCSGASVDCPPDAVASAGVACGGTGPGSCATPGICNGTGATCPGATPLAAGAVCLPADPSSPCDVDDVCDGTTDVCRALFATAGTTCGAAGTEICDAPDVCAGGSATCVPTFLSGTECRPSRGTCDVAEACSGTSPACPVDGVLAGGIACRPSALACDPEETCDGIAITCPADVNACTDAPPSDGGTTDAGRSVDASSADAASPPIASAGCACRAGTRATPHLAVLLTPLVSLARRKRRAGWESVETIDGRSSCRCRSR